MKLSLFASLLLIGWLAATTTSVDPMARLDKMLSNRTIVETYCKCFLDKGPCAQDARTLKKLLPDFIATRCEKCTDRQKFAACKILHTLQHEKYETYWTELLKKFDPESVHRRGLNGFMKNCAEVHHIVD